MGIVTNMGECPICSNEIENILHGAVAGHTLLGYIQQVVPEFTPETAVRLELGPGLSCEEELATVSTLAIGLKYIWETRSEKKQLYIYKMKADIEVIISLLGNSSEIMQRMLGVDIV